jgi:glycosyltransferase involved in cell wall biosynthesis
MTSNPETSLSVSVVIPFYNGSRFIKEALASVTSQTMPVLEIIVVDDGSRAEEAAALDWAADGIANCTVIHLERNRGACVARNIGIVRAKGTHIAMLDCDDLWLPDKTEKQVRFLRENPSYRAVHSAVRVRHEDGREVVAHKNQVNFQDLVHFPCPAFPSAVIMQREAMLECGLFNPTKRACQDLDMFLRFTSQYAIGVVDEPLVVRRVQADGISRNAPVFWHEADRVYRDYRYVFEDGSAAADTLVELHADFMLRAFYARNGSFFWNVVKRAVRRDVTILRLFLRFLGGVLRNRLSRTHSRPQAKVLPGPTPQQPPAAASLPGSDEPPQEKVS